LAAPRDDLQFARERMTHFGGVTLQVAAPSVSLAAIRRAQGTKGGVAAARRHLSSRW
jgi:hypothetical protein